MKISLKSYLEEQYREISGGNVALTILADHRFSAFDESGASIRVIQPLKMNLEIDLEDVEHLLPLINLLNIAYSMVEMDSNHHHLDLGELRLQISVGGELWISGYNKEEQHMFVLNAKSEIFSSLNKKLTGCISEWGLRVVYGQQLIGIPSGFPYYHFF